MRTRPRTCPSIRFSRFVTDAFAFACIESIYSHRVYVSRDSVVDHSAHAHNHGAHPHSAHTDNAGASARDPVCGMKVDPAKTSHHHAYRDHDYHFCGAGCRTKFAAAPEKYLNTAPAPATP